MRCMSLAFIALSFLACQSQEAPHSGAARGTADTVPPRASLVGSDDGERLQLGAPATGSVVLKADPTTGSKRMTFFTETLEPGAMVPPHRHLLADEILYVEDGYGTALADQDRIPVESGATVLIPEGAWHGIENTGDRTLHLIFVTAPPGIEEFFREVGSPPGGPQPQPLSPEMVELFRRHGIELAPPPSDVETP